MSSTDCPLCSGKSSHYHTKGQRAFFKCSLCLSVFTHPDSFITPAEEQAHYECHNNDPDDTGYRNFLSPVTNRLLAGFAPKHKGLDFGSGTGSPIVKVLQENSYDISRYDLFFHNDPERLSRKYDYISCTEVAEHFKEPYKEFTLLRNLLQPGGILYLMTEMLDDGRDFESWYYKNDPTHVFLYHPRAFEWIRDNFDFKKVTIDKRVIILES